MPQTQPQDPFTKFFVDMEHKWLRYWQEHGIVEKYLRKNDASEKRFSFQDGPITANNPMGVHHAWGRTYKDLWQKFNNLLGKKQRFQNGFDCQGLWVEVEVEKELGLKSKKDIENLVSGDPFASIAKFVQLCKERVTKFSEIQTEQSKRLGYFMDWDHSYYTMDDDNNYMIWKFLKVCHENGWIYKGHESVPWCPRCETAISQHEMLTEDYKEVEHESIYLELPIEGKANEYLLVWTTTPWTLPANIAVAVDSNLEYSLVKGASGDCFWVAKDLVKRVFGKEYQSIEKTAYGKELLGLKYKGPFDDLEAVSAVAKTNPDTFHTVVATDTQILPITIEEGTGLVHTAVSAGTEDFKLGKLRGLPMIPVIADNADYLPHMGFLAGKNAKYNPRIILDYLEEKDRKESQSTGGWVFKIEKYKHRYPGCWRCKAELVWKVADEWYIAMDKDMEVKDQKSNLKADERTLRQRMIEVAKKIHWVPEFGLDRELDWLNNMHDWLISKKNRYWGLALPIYECPVCKTFDVLGSKEELKLRAVKGWDLFEGKSPHKPFIDQVLIQCPKCGGEVQRIGDVGNPWLDAGIVPYSTIKEHNLGEPLYSSDLNEWKKWFPINFITESFPGQFKNWFYAMIAMSTVLEDTPPFQNVLGFGTLLGEDGRPMHKSWGNSIAFHEGADEIGVDVMRWMYARHNPADNLLFGYSKANEVRRQFYLLIWNIAKFYRTNKEADKPSISIKKGQSENVLDTWILSRFADTGLQVKQHLLEFNQKDAALSIEEFVQDLSAWYIRRSRDRVGPSSEDEESKIGFYQTTEYILIHLSIILSPFLPFLSEELYTSLTNKESVHLAMWPAQKNEDVHKDLMQDMKLVRDICEHAHRERKSKQMKVRQPLSLLTIGLPKSHQLLLQNNKDAYTRLIADEINVKKVEFVQSKEGITVEYDLEITGELRLEGEMRDLIRQIQNERKKLGINIQDTISVSIPKKFQVFEKFIQKHVLAKTITYAETMHLEKL